MKPGHQFVLLTTAGVLACGAWVIAQNATPQEAPPVFRVATDLVEVDVSVLDNRRRPVRDLTAADFTVFENGKPRPVETFTFVDVPDRETSRDVGWMSEVPSDVATNRTLTQEGRLVVVLMDRTIPVGQPTITAREVAAAAVNALGPGDLAAVVSTSGGVPQNFTADRARLLRAINQRDWSTGPSGEVAQIEAGIHQGFDDVFSPLTDGRCLCGLCVPETITRVAEALEGVSRRRKSMIFVGSDFIVQAGPQVQQAELGCGQKLEDARERMFAALDRSGLVVHGVDPSGLESVGSPTADNRWAVRGPARIQTMQQHLVRQNRMHVVPDHTGGRTVLNVNAADQVIPDLVRESASYYLIGFRPAGADVSRPVRSIDVRVNRRDVEVRSRRQFSTAAPARDAAAATPGDRALGGLLPTTQLPLDVHLAAFSTPGSARPTVTVAIGLDAFVPPSDATTRHTPIDVVVGAFDATGQPRASARQSLNLEWPVPTAGTQRRTEALTRLALDAGDYEIRVAVSNPQTGQVSSVFTYAAVPAFASVPFTLSAIVIEAPHVTTSVPREALRDLLPVVPATTRTFRRADGPIPAFFRVYQGTARTDALNGADVRVRIIDASDRTVRDEVMPLQATSFGDGRAADCRISLPIPQLPPGDYLLRLEAQMGERVAGRAMRFTVE
jgi:VWFA-related protein